MPKQPHELGFDDHSEGLANGLAGLLRVMNGRGKVSLIGAERDDALALLHTLRVALAQNGQVVAHLVGMRHHLLKQQRAEAEAAPPAPEAA